MLDENDPTYIFQNQETNEIVWFIPIAKLLKFLDIKELNFILCNASGNTCQINGMLDKVVKENKFFTKFLTKFTDVDISHIQNTLKKSSVSSRDGWQDEANPVSIIKLFNDGVEYNRELAVSCSGVRDNDMIGVIRDDFLSKYFDKATKGGTYHKELFYYRNLNITKTSKLVTGMSNFNTETFRSKLLDQYRFLDNDMCIYDFEDSEQYRSSAKYLFRLISQNEFLKYDSDEERYIRLDLYKINDEELLKIVNQINQKISDFLKLANPNNELCVEYDVETRRFLMIDEKGKLRDATAYLYTTLCDYLKQKDLAKSVGKLKNFIENKQNLCIMNEVVESHYEKKFNLVKNIAEYFESDLIDSSLKAIEFTEEEKNQMKEYFFDKSPFEFFFKNPDEIKNKLNEDRNDDVQQHPDKEDSITKYILEKNINEILTSKGKEFLDMIKEIASSNEYFKSRIKEDEIDKTFEKYQSQNGINCTYENNKQNKKTKIEFSVLKALIESVDSRSSKAYQIFFERLSDYLNYFFCNDKNLSKKELKDSIKKKIDELKKATDDIQQKRDAREQEIGKMADESLSDSAYEKKFKEIENKYGTRNKLIEQLQKAQNQDKNFKQTIFCSADIKTKFEISDENDQPIGLNKFEKYLLGYDKKIFNDNIVRPKIKKFVKDNELFKDKSVEATEDEERIDIKTKHLMEAIENYLSGVTGKKTFDWFNLYVNYVCQHTKMKFNKIMDAVVDQNDLEKDPDGQLDFLITDIIVEYKKAFEEIKSDKEGTKLINSHNNFGIMNLFHLLQSFINAGSIFTYDLSSEEMCEFLYNANEINFLINHHSKKLIKAIRDKKNKSVDGLINRLLQDISLEQDTLAKKICKMSVYAFSTTTAAVDHMTQINMAQFFSKIKDIQRKFSNGIMLDENGSVGCFMIPIQKALEICKTNAPDSFKKDINKMLSKLPDEMKWTDLDQECDLFLDKNKYKMLSPVEVSKMFCTTKQLVEKAKDDFYCFKLLIQREQNQFDEFLSQNSDNRFVFGNYKISRNKNIFNTVMEEHLKNNLILSIEEINDSFCFISETAKNGTKFGLNATEKFILLAKKVVEMVGLEIEEINFNPNNYVANDLKKYTDIINEYAIDILVNFVGKTYFTWNNIIEKSDPKNNLCEKIIRNSLVILNIASQHIKKDDISKNQDLILWLYLIYKKINFDSDFSKARDKYENPLKLSDEPHFLKEYKILDGYDVISSKNVFYINDRIQEFKDYLSKNNFSDLIFFVDKLPRDWENLTSIIKTKEYSGKLLKRCINSKQVASWVLKYQAKLLKRTHDPKELFNVAQNNQNASHVFYAIKTLYKIQSYDTLQKLLLSDNLETNVLKKLCMDTKINDWPRKKEDERNMFLDSIEIFSDLVLQQKMKISFTSAVYLIKSIANFVLCKFDDVIEKCYSDICDDKYKKYFRGDKNIFSVAAEIVGQIPFPANAVIFWENAKENLLSLCKNFDHIFFSETINRKETREEGNNSQQKIYKNHKDLALWLYLLYKKIFYDKDEKISNLNNDTFLLREYKVDDGIEKIRQKYIFWDDYHIKDFSQWVKDNGIGNVCYFFYENTLSEEILIEIAFNHGDCQALYNFVKKFPEKAQEYLLSNDKNNVIQKLCLLCTEKTEQDLRDVYLAIRRAEKISFRVALSAIKFVHDFHTKFRENTKTDVFKKEFDKLFPQPLKFILYVIEGIYFADEKLENYASIDEYKNFLKIVVEEIYFYEEEIKDNGIDKYFSEDNKWDLIWYLYLLHRKIINNENYIVNEQSDNVEFKKVDGDYFVDNYRFYKVLDPYVPSDKDKRDKRMNKIVNLFYAKNMFSLCEFGIYPSEIFSNCDNSLARFSLQDWIKKFKRDPKLFFPHAKNKINKQVFKILANGMKEAKAKEKTKNMIKKKYCFTLAKNLKQLKDKIKRREKLKKILEKRQTKINKEKELNTLKKWKERKDKDKEAKEKTKNMIKKKYYCTLVKDFKQFKALDLLKKRIIKKNRRNVTDSLKEAENENNKQKRSNAWSKIKKIIYVAVVDLVLIALAIIFLKEIILITALIALAIVFIVFCGVAIKNGRDYKNLGIKISVFEEKQRRLNILPQQQIVPGRENFNHDPNLIKNN